MCCFVFIELRNWRLHWPSKGSELHESVVRRYILSTSSLLGLVPQETTSGMCFACLLPELRKARIGKIPLSATDQLIPYWACGQSLRPTRVTTTLTSTSNQTSPECKRVQSIGREGNQRIQKRNHSSILPNRVVNICSSCLHLFKIKNFEPSPASPPGKKSQG